MQRWGLTGGIASGKSTVAAMLRELGFNVLDADNLAHQLIEPEQPAYQEVVEQFGREILDPNGRIDRRKLGALVFADRSKLEALNALVHPRVAKATQDQFEVWERDGVRDAAFVEAALIVEAGMHKQLHGVAVAWCEPQQQLDRLVARGMSPSEAQRRIALQMPNDEKLRYATETIDCSRSLEETRQQVQALAARLRQTMPGSPFR